MDGEEEREEEKGKERGGMNERDGAKGRTKEGRK